MISTRQQYEAYVSQFRAFVLEDPSLPVSALFPFLLVEAHTAIHMTTDVFSSWWAIGDMTQRTKRLGREIKSIDDTTCRAVRNFMSGDKAEDAFWRTYLPNVNFYQFMKIVGMYTTLAPPVVFLGGEIGFSLAAFAEFQRIFNRMRRPKRKVVDCSIILTKTQPFPKYDPSRKLARVGRVDLDP